MRTTLFHDDSDVILSHSIRDGKASAARRTPPVVHAPAGDESDNASIYRPQQQTHADASPIRLGPGPHLFLDEFLIDQSRGVSRRVNQPRRDPQIPNPLITGKEDGCNGPYLTVVRDPDSGRFRIWYNTNKVKFQDGSSHVAVLESDDGIHWQRPHRVLADPGGVNFGSSVLDEGAGFPDPTQRYKLAWWYGGGLRLAVSSDGLQWTAWKPYAVIRHNHDINNISIDQQLPIRDEVYLYYGGYKFGHKMDRWEGRQIGMVRMQRDRYVSREAGPDGGFLITPAVVLTGGAMTVNANIRGELRAALLNADHTPVPGFAAEDCQPVQGDSLRHVLQWKRPLSDLREMSVRIAFRLRDAGLYGFELDTDTLRTGSQP